MKYYKVENNEFKGFYDEEVNSDQLFDTIYEDKMQNLEKKLEQEEETKYSTLDIQYEKVMTKVPIKVLKPYFYEINESTWINLLNGQSEGKEIRILKNGELGLYTKPICNIEGSNVVFDYDKEIWVDEGTSYEQLAYWENQLIQVQEEIDRRLKIGFGATQEQLQRKDLCLKNHNLISHDIANHQNLTL